MATRTALVTGGTGGLGGAVAAAFAAAGWRVVLPVRPGGAAEPPPTGALTVAADLTDP
ncbi:MAG TPA: oxidoreductase, partial [Pilimelia sp.]|nr:oxidoreductase [Pilimelia sp.]